MGRFARRVSRSLIGALIVTLVLGLAFFLKNIASTRAEEAKQAAAAAPVESPRASRSVAMAPLVVPTTNPTPAPTETQTPSFAPAAAAPTTPAVSFAPSPATKPDAVVEAASAPTDAISRGKAKFDAGDLLAARKILNDALASNSLSDADTTSAKSMLSEINKSVVFSPKRFADDEFGGTYSVQPGDLLQKVAVKYEVPWECLMRLNGMTDPKKLRAGQTIKVIHGPFNVVVSKGKFNMDLYLGPPGEKGAMYVTSYPVGLGQNDSTPTGVWLVEPGKKLKNPTYYSARGEGIIDADDPKNPLGERWIGLTGIDGHAIGAMSYGIHGTIDETSIGKQESQGCIRMHNADVEWVFDLLVEGKSQVIIKD